MDFRRLGNILAALGAVVLAGAFIWWFQFYSSVASELKPVAGGKATLSVWDAKSCLYTSSDFCGLVSGGARLLGATPYEPMLFWAGLVALIIGVVIRLAAKPAQTS
jgi:hypothetical protein